MTLRPRSVRPLTLALCALLAALPLISITFTIAGPPSSPQDAVERAWELARSSGSYRYRAAIDQTSRPAPSLSAAGSSPRREQVIMEGSIDVPGETLELELQRGGGATVALRVDHGRAYGRQGAGAWREVENATDVFAPGGDPLGFLAGARNIQAAGGERRQLGDEQGLTLAYDRFTFDLDGIAFANRLGDQLEAQLRLRGQLPPGATLNPDAYRDLRGQGELWVDGDGLPRRMMLQVQLPTPRGGERVSADLTVDYLAFDRARLAVASTGLLESPSAWAAYRLSVHAPALRELGLLIALCLAAALIVGVLARSWRSRRAYALTVCAVLISILTVPQLRARSASAFYDRQEQQAQAQEQAREQADGLEQGQAALRANTWDPNRNPLDGAGGDPAPIGAVREPPLPAFRSGGTTNPVALATTASTSVDSDGDGLSDADEEYWGSCPSLTSGSDFCDGVVSAKDSDADGLGDGVEVQDLGILPNTWDSDGDTITDTLEVKGFLYKGQTWYLDPDEDDTNKDGLLDGNECAVWSRSSSSFNPSGTCPDTDADGTPDVFDGDNDGDGVPDNADSSPGATLAQTFSASNPLLLSVSGLTANKPVYVDIQLRTKDPSHISYQGTVLDWPAGDTEGQITRRLSSTFADTYNTDLQTSDANAANGDIRMVPMLEVTIPRTSGHYGNLPVNATYQGQSRPSGAAVDTWLDSEIMEAYGIYVNDVDASSGDLVFYAPLSPVVDKYGDGRVALSTRMYYRPTITGTGGTVTWGSAQQVRLVWLVQLLTDDCTDEDNLAQVPPPCDDSITVIHSYDDEWKVTGLNVTENHGLDVAIVYEDPARDSDLNLDSELWSAAWNLGSTFLRGRDCDSMSGSTCTSDGLRDVRIGNLASSINSWSGGAANNDLAVQTFSYTDEAYVASIMSTEAPAILSTVFTPYASQTVPTLLYAQENTTRAVNLDSASGLSASQPTLSFSGAATGTNASLTWAPYQYTGGTWQNYDSEEYLTALKSKLTSDAFFQATGSGEESEDELAGKLIWALSYYSALITGVANLVEVDADPAWYQSRVFDESIFEATWPASTTYGFTFLGFHVLTAVGAAIPSLIARDGTFFEMLGKGTFEETRYYAFEFAELMQTGWVKTGLGILMGAATIAASVGVVLFAIGYFSGNSTYLEIGIYLLNAATVVIVGLYLANMVYLYYMVKISMTALRPIAMAAQLAKFSAVGFIGLAIGFAVAWGMFVYQCISMNLQPGTVAFNMAFARMIAAAILILVFFFLDLSLVGTIVVLLIFVIDAILALFGESGIQEWLTAKIADMLYDVDFVVLNMDSADRLQFDVASLALSDSSLGFVESNAINYSLNITNTIRYDPDDFSESDARKTTFRYELKNNDRWIYGVDHDQMNDEWSRVGNNKLRATATKSLARSLSFKNLRTGVNRSLNGWLYLVEEFVLPYEGCWKVVLWDVDCTWYYYEDTNAINLGQYQYFDILPDTIGGFAGMGWNNTSSLRFPTQKDLDGDGLKVKTLGGTDPDDTKRDSDGDGIDDPGELADGTNASRADSDGDGLSDRDEIAYETKPLLADSDADGLSDYFEIRQGWMIGYENTSGALLQTRVWSDANSADADNDGLDDLTEYRYAFNPRAANSLSQLDSMVSFDSVEVKETIAPQLLLRFEEGQGATSFADSAGAGAGATTCAGSACPSSDAAGRYGSALSLDGADYLSTASGVTELGQGSFTIGAWVKTTATSQAIVTKSDGDGGWEQGEKSFYIDGSGRPAFVGWGNNYIVGSAAVNDGSWHHVAVTWDYSARGAAIYVDGSKLTNTGSTNYTPNNADNGADLLYVGRANAGGEAPNSFNGSLDEVAVFSRALAAADIADLKDGRYNPNDLLVAPGTELTYQAVITNTNSTLGINGHLTGAASGSDPAIGAPAAALRFEQSDRVTTFTNGTGESSTATCAGDSCPAIETVSGRATNAAHFGKVASDTDDYISLPSLVTNGDTSINSYTVAFWLRLDSRPFNRLAQIFETDSSAYGALSMAVHPDGSLVVGVGGNISSYSTTHLAAGSWYHVLLTTNSTKTQLYINGVLDPYDLPQNNMQFTQFIVGPGRIGNNMEGTEPLNGTLDDLVFYNKKTASSAGISSIYGGTYFAQIGGDFYYPTLLLQFSDSGSVAFTNRMTDANAAVCASAGTCPSTSTSGVFGGAALSFDGADDYLALDRPVANDFTIAFWLKTTQATGGASQWAEGRGLVDASVAGVASDFGLALGNGGQVMFGVGAGGDTTIKGGDVDDGQWHHVVATRVMATGELSLYVDGALVASGAGGTGSLAAAPALRLGALQTGGNPYSGLLDEVVVSPSLVDAAGAVALMQSSFPLIDIDGDFRAFSVGARSATTASGTATVSANIANGAQRFEEEVEAALAVNATPPVVDANAASLAVYMPFEEASGATSFGNLVDSSRDGTCASPACPTAGLRTQVDRGLYFDGVDDRLRPELTTTTFNADSIAAWVKADRGTLVDLRGGNGLKGLQLDTNALQLTVDNNGSYLYYTVPVSLTKNVWTHVAATFDRTSRVATVYLNGAQSATLTIPAWAAGGSFSGFQYPSVGADADGGDYLHGYLDDLRIYKDLTLSASQVQSLYLSSTPLLRFEFDEDEGLSSFVDKGPSAYVGQPTAARCADVSIDSLTPAALASSSSTLYIARDGDRIATISSPSVGATSIITASSVICEGELIEVGTVGAKGVTTAIATRAVDVTAPGAGSGVFASGSNSVTLSWTVADALYYTYNPATGADGKLGHGAVFDGSGAITIPGASTINNLTSTFTVMAWVHPDDVSSTTSQALLSAGTRQSTNGFGVGVYQKQLWLSNYSLTRLSGSVLSGSGWQHVAVVYDYASSPRTLKFYVDGVLKTTVSDTNVPAIAANADDDLFIGGRLTGSGMANMFDGQLDELAVYGRSLSAAEVSSIYNREVVWFRTSSATTLRVDSDLPAVELLTDYAYRPLEEIQLAAATSDASSSVTLLDVGITTPGGSTSWSSAPVCAEAVYTNAAWCPSFDPTASGEGPYQVTLRAVDLAGNQTTTSPATILVDGTAPVASSSYNKTQRTVVEDPTIELSWTVALKGTIADPGLPYGNVGSGLVTDTVMVQLFDETGEAVADGSQQATISGTQWSVNYVMTGARPTGYYTVQVTAEDQVGNRATTTVGSLMLDTRAPTVDFDRDSLPEYAITAPISYTGWMIDLPEPAGALASYHFEPALGLLADTSGSGLDASCTSCPTSSYELFGEALSFSKAAQNDVTVPATTALDLDVATFSAWVRPAWTSRSNGYDPAILAIGDQTGIRFSLHMRDNYSGINLYTNEDEAGASATLTPQSWHHIALAQTGSGWTIYVNGLPVGTGETPFSAVTGRPLHIGSSTGQSAFFTGDIDEVRIYDRVLGGEEIYAMAQSRISGAGAVWTALERADFDVLQAGDPYTPTLDWQEAILDDPETKFTTWRQGIPNGLEDYYQIHLRGEDMKGYTSADRIIWRGVIDTLAPRLSFSARLVGQGDLAQTEYSFEVDDLFLDVDSLDQPCADAGVLLSTYTNPARTNGATVSCRVAGHQGTTTATACDYGGRCASVMVTPTGDGDPSTVIIQSPVTTDTLRAAFLTPISGVAYDPDGLQSLEVLIDGVTIATTSLGGATGVTPWAAGWRPAAAGGYTLTARITDALGNKRSHVMTLKVAESRSYLIPLVAR